MLRKLIKLSEKYTEKIGLGKYFANCDIEGREKTTLIK
jgi:hypothetical protein